MSRDIRFRAWHEPYGYLHNFMGNFLMTALNQSDYIIEQFTGMLDENENPIYEGDIIKGTRRIWPRGDCDSLWAVVFVRGALSHGYDWRVWDLETIEVIGNIHEHSQLLEKAEA